MQLLPSFYISAFLDSFNLSVFEGLYGAAKVCMKMTCWVES